MRRLLVLISIVAVVSTGGVAQATTHRVEPEGRPWDELVTAAKQEDKVVVRGPASSEARKMLPAAFKARFGITMEYITGRSSEMAARLRAERNAGLYTVDAIVGGIDTVATVFHPEKMLAPLRPELILPEVIDGSKWKKGELWFADPEQQYVLRLSSTVTAPLYINTSNVRPGELRSVSDLFDPKWRGKISVMDPTAAGSNTPGLFLILFGEEGLKKLYLDQRPAMSRDERQLTDWLLRGTYPIAFKVDDVQVEKMEKEGMPVAAVYDLPGLPASLSSGNGILVLLDQAPHPAAAKLFVNWIASKEGSETLARAFRISPTRNDIDEASFLPPEAIPRPGTTYLDPYVWEFVVNTREKARLHTKDLLGR